MLEPRLWCMYDGLRYFTMYFAVHARRCLATMAPPLEFQWCGTYRRQLLMQKCESPRSNTTCRPCLGLPPKSRTTSCRWPRISRMTCADTVRGMRIPVGAFAVPRVRNNQRFCQFLPICKIKKHRKVHISQLVLP